MRKTPVPQPRVIQKQYCDPIEVIWVHCLEHLGWQLERSSEVFASWDGDRVLTIGQKADLDPDDSLAQLLLHELCHALVEGKEAWQKIDWGLDNIDDRHLLNELACHRLQAALADQVGLRSFFAVTTDWRPYYDSIPNQWNALQTQKAILPWSEAFGCSLIDAKMLDQQAIAMAQRGLELLQNEVLFHQAIAEALDKTAKIAELLKPCVIQTSLWF